jgi:membrane-bound lytic murein transglycosylase B
VLRRHRRRLKPCLGVIVVVVLTVMPAPESPLPHAPAPVPFDAWLAALMGEAIGAGIDARLVTEALAPLAPLQQVIDADQSQVEVITTLDEYLRARVTPDLIAQGREMMRHHRALLDAVERAFGVPRQFVVAIWGAETYYGRYTGDVPVFPALATLAWQPRRAAYFRRELFAALTIVGGEQIKPQALVGSWAGAMGQPQFMPSSYLEYAVDFDGDGRRDIWGSVADTLASIANYLQRFGWKAGQTWGREVTLGSPGVSTDATRRSEPGDCAAMRVLSRPRTVAEWAALGVRRVDGARLLNVDVEASVVTIDRRSFLLYPNYTTVLRYNCSHRYALSVSMLADRIR